MGLPSNIPVSTIVGIATTASILTLTSYACYRTYKLRQPAGGRSALVLSNDDTHSSTSSLTIVQDYFQERKDTIVSNLATAITLRTVSYEDSNGNAISLCTPTQQQPKDLTSNTSSSSTVSSTPVTKRCHGCACNKHAIDDSMGRESSSSSSSSSHSSPHALSDDFLGSGTVPTAQGLDTIKEEFLRFHSLLQKRFPLLHSHPRITRHIINEYSLVYIFRTGNTTTESGGIALAAHMDVVPVPDQHDWIYPPFSGTVAIDPVNNLPHIWGRGSIDDKQSVIGICEAMEYVLSLPSSDISSNWSVPYIVLCFGHDEELGGPDGAASIAKELPQLLIKDIYSNNSQKLPKVPFEWLLDEGLFLLEGFFPGHKERVAVVCVGEKGHVNVELKVEAPAGHSSIPPVTIPTTTLGILARAITRIENNPYPCYRSPADQLFEALVPGMRLFPHAFLFSNLWLTWPVVKHILLATPASAALLRTTTAVTMAKSGIKSNVLPPLSTALINHRIHPNESVASVIARDKAIINDPRVTVTAYEALEPAPVSSILSKGFSTIKDCIHTVFGKQIAVAPGLMLGNTDTRHYWSLAKDIYRHCPTELNMEGTKRFHGKNERIEIQNLLRLCTFYTMVLLRGGGEHQ